MKAVLLAGLVVAASAAAYADPPKAPCIDPQKSYIARPLNAHDVYARTTLGSPKPAARLTTTCVHLVHADYVSLSSQFTCVAQGDMVIATILGGDREACKVAFVRPYVPDKDDMKQY